MFESTGAANTQWERQTLQKVLMEHIAEQRRARRWGIFFKLVMICFFVAMFCLFYGALTKDLTQPALASIEHTALIDLKGEVGADDSSSADNMRDALKLVYSSKNVKGVVIRINSPGGSPVQARQIYDEIRSYKQLYPEIKVYAAIEDLGTSAAYLIACATDSIYADKTSLVGSIGVRIDSFGFVEAMNKVGVERRLYVAGKFKGALDPFLPRNPEEDAFVDTQLKLVHQAFINNVREGRGTRLRETPDIFSGLFWSGEQALGMGLIDGYGDAYWVAKEIVKVENVVDYSPSTSLLDRLANRVGASIGHFLSVQMGLQQKAVR
jgi:protease-4